ncbi:MAG: DIP1984 family protein [Bacteroidales bacterium]|nr:DIP1984 family protein [Bacteroidales bacterium]
MKLAEALSLRADIQKRIDQMQGRLEQSVKVQEGDVPAEDPQELFAELNNLVKQLEDLIFRINVTNTNTILPCGESLTLMMARREVLTKKVAILRSALNNALQLNDRFSRTEIKMVRTVDIPTLRKQCDTLSEELRLLEVEIQSANWTTDICD